MLKRIAKKFFSVGSPGQSPDGLFLDVRCEACGEVFHLFINKSTDLLQNFDEQGSVTYSLKKEIVGGHCKNLIHVKIEFDGAKNQVSRAIENGEFIEGS
jgi:hypothetical protein